MALADSKGETGTKSEDIDLPARTVTLESTGSSKNSVCSNEREPKARSSIWSRPREHRKLADLDQAMVLQNVSDITLNSDHHPGKNF
ncbi:MAG TPA: hypothetical protein VKF84_10785 [Candidatus Sulfotelmatobacter sp.]|nr:hypothetical protein [Candidatus Sulfotelmatobacter sp.]